MKKIFSKFKFFSEVIAEIKKISFPTWIEVRNATIIVIISVIIVTIIIGAIDYGIFYTIKNFVIE